MLDEDKLHDLLPSAKLTFVDASAEGAKVPGTGGHGDATEVPHLLWFFLLLAVFTNEFFLATWGAGGRRPGRKGRGRLACIRRRARGSAAWRGRGRNSGGR